MAKPDVLDLAIMRMHVYVRLLMSDDGASDERPRATSRTWVGRPYSLTDGMQIKDVGISRLVCGFVDHGESSHVQTKRRV